MSKASIETDIRDYGLLPMHEMHKHTYENCHNATCRIKCMRDGWNDAVEEIISKAILIVYEANDRERNPQPRDMVADIHYKLLELQKEMTIK